MNDPASELRLTDQFVKYDLDTAQRPIDAYQATLEQVRAASSAMARL